MAKRKALHSLIAFAYFASTLMPVAPAYASQAEVASETQSVETKTTSGGESASVEKEPISQETKNEAETEASDGEKDPARIKQEIDESQQINQTTTSMVNTNGAMDLYDNQAGLCISGYYTNETVSYCCPYGTVHGTKTINGRTYNACLYKSQTNEESISESNTASNSNSDSDSDSNNINSVLPWMMSGYGGGIYGDDSSDNGDTGRVQSENREESNPETYNPYADSNSSAGTEASQQGQSGSSSSGESQWGISQSDKAPFEAIMDPSILTQSDLSQVTVTLIPHHGNIGNYKIYAIFSDFSTNDIKTVQIKENEPFILIPEGVSRLAGTYNMKIVYVSLDNNKRKSYTVTYTIGETITTINQGGSSSTPTTVDVRTLDSSYTPSVPEVQYAPPTVSVDTQTPDETSTEGLSVLGYIVESYWDNENNACKITIDGIYSDETNSSESIETIYTDKMNEQSCSDSTGSYIELSLISEIQDNNGNTVFWNRGTTRISGKSSSSLRDERLLHANNQIANPQGLQYLNISNTPIAYNPMTQQFVGYNGEALTDSQIAYFAEGTGINLSSISVIRGYDGLYRAYDENGNQVSSENGFTSAEINQLRTGEEEEYIEPVAPTTQPLSTLADIDTSNTLSSQDEAGVFSQIKNSIGNTLSHLQLPSAENVKDFVVGITDKITGFFS